MHPEEQLSAYLDGELSQEEALLVEEHLNACPSCRSLLDELKEFQTRFTAGMFGLAEPPDLEIQIMQAVTVGDRKRRFEKIGMLIPFFATLVFLLLAVTVGPVVLHFMRSVWTVGRVLLYAGSHVLADMPVLTASSVILLLGVMVISLLTLRRLLRSVTG